MKYLIIVLFLIVSIAPNAQNLNFNKGRSVKKNYYTEVKYDFVKGKIIIPVVIEGEIYKFLLDTGAPNMITSSLRGKIETKFLKSISVKDANDKTMALNVVSVPLLTIANVSFKNIPTIVNHKDTNFIFDCFEIDGIIGSNMLRKSIIQFLPIERLIKLTNDENKITFNENSVLELSLMGNQSSPHIWINIQGKDKAKEHVLFDTGMNDFYDLSLKNYRILKKRNIFYPISQGIGVKGIGLFGEPNKNQHFRLLTPVLKVNKAVFNNVMVMTSDSKRSRIGSDLLSYGNVTIDFKNKKFYFDAFNDKVDLSKKILGFSPAIVNNELVVGIVWNKELKEEISFEDKIINVNGVDFQNIDICDFITKESVFKTNDTLEIEFADAKGIKKTIKLNKKLPLVQD